MGTDFDGLDTFVKEHPLFSDYWEPNNAYRRHGEVKRDSQLGLAFDEKTGTLVESKYFAAAEAFGKLKRDAIDESSHTKFGFPAISDSEAKERKLPEANENSRWELHDLSDDERLSLKFYTGFQHEWINDALDGYGELRADLEGQVYKKKFVEGTYDESEGLMLLKSEVTPNALKEVTGLLDEAIAKSSSGAPRILYRGQTNVDPDMKVRDEITVDGYQSSSLHASVASKFARTKGDRATIFEIYTPEGANVTNLSYMKDEMEVLLPRDSRYVVMDIQKDVTYMGIATQRLVRLVAVDDTGAVLNSGNRHKPKPLVESQMRLKPA